MNLEIKYFKIIILIIKYLIVKAEIPKDDKECKAFVFDKGHIPGNIRLLGTYKIVTT